MSPDPHRRARLLCLLTALAHVVAGAASATLLAGGSFLVGEPARRARYVADHPWAWAAGWTAWIAATLGLLAVLGLLVRRTPARRRGLALAGFAIALAGALVDLGCQVINACFMPVLAGGLAVRDWQLWESVLLACNIYAGNTAYSVGGALVNLGVAADPALPRGAAWGALPAWAVGLALTAAWALGRLQVVAAATGLVLVLFTGWLVLLARTYFAPPSSTGTGAGSS